MQLQSILVAAFFALGVAAQAGCPRDAKLCYDACCWEAGSLYVNTDCIKEMQKGSNGHHPALFPADLGEPWAPSAKLTFHLAGRAQHVLHVIRPRHPVQAALLDIPFPGRARGADGSSYLLLYVRKLLAVNQVGYFPQLADKAGKHSEENNLHEVNYHYFGTIPTYLQNGG
uniref:Uncharacterized protein n=1 Tax=Pyricularia oryzae (strain P131) TaxID=1143193 RepID=L7IPP3_PYRO1